MKKILSSLLSAIPLALISSPLFATSLVEAWQGARTHDYELSAAHSDSEAGTTRRDQSRALWLPTVVASGTAGRATSESTTKDAGFAAPNFGRSTNVEFQTSVNDGTLRRWSVSAVQPIYNRARLAQSRQLDASADASNAAWVDAQQAAILRTSKRYFDVVIAQAAVRLAQRQQAAVERALGEAKERYRLGDIPITDSHEALARAEGIQAQLLAAETELQLKQQAFRDQTGMEPNALWVPKTIRSDNPGPLAGWLQRAADGSPTIRMQAAKLVASKEEAARYGVLASPTLDLVAQSGREQLSGSGDYGSNALNESRNKMIGLQLTIPIFTGGMRSAKHTEAIKLADKARAENERTRQLVAQQTRAAWLGLTVGAARETALETAAKASLARLEATKLGHKVGDRTMLDLLNAENDASASELELLKARINLLLDRLRLAAAVGSLDENELSLVNAALTQP